jgi:pimeloyl-ACP methyl ester carboxylesterase
VAVDEHTIEVAGEPVFYRRVLSDGATALLLHGVPTSADDWEHVLPVTGGVAVDLPGFGRSGKGGQLDYTVDGYVAFLVRLLDTLELEQVAIVGHGWGATFGLMLAAAHPERVTRIALFDAVPLREGFTWPAIVRWWRRPVIGEFLMGSINRRLLARGLRSGATTPAAWSDERIAHVWEQFDQGTQRAILRLHRYIDAAEIASKGPELERVVQPALVLWGDDDPWLPSHLADTYASVLRNATVEHIPGAGHWPWLDRPELAQRLAAFVNGA